MHRFYDAIVRFISRRSWWVVILFILLLGAVAPGITLLQSETGFNAMVSNDSELWQDNLLYQEEFGGEPLTVLLAGDIDDIFSPYNLGILADFEQQVNDDARYRSVLSPLMVLQVAIAEAEQAQELIMQQLALAQEQAAAEARQMAANMGLNEVQQEAAAQQAREAVLQQFQPQLEQLQQMGEPSLDNQTFIDMVVFDQQGNISEALQSLVPDDEHALIIVNPVGNMEQDESLAAANDIEAFFNDNILAGTEVSVTADAQLLDSLTSRLTKNIAILLGLSVGAMVLILALIFRVRWRMLSLLMVALGAVMTFGIVGYISFPITMATMAVLPILIGLGIDYSIQFQNRYQEEVLRCRTVGEAVETSVSHMFPTVGLALLATIIGFITLFISEVPMIRDFGAILAMGIVLCYITGLFLLNSSLNLSDRKIPIEKLRRAASQANDRFQRVISRVARLAIKYTLPIFIIALAFAIGGGIVDQQLPVSTDYEEFMPQDIPELEELRELRQIAGSGGEIRFMIEANDVTSVEIMLWMQDYQQEELAKYPELLSVNSPAILVSQATGGAIPNQQQIDQILANTPDVYLGQTVSADHKLAIMSFAIEYISLEEIHTLSQAMQQDAWLLPGMEISPVGTIALSASTVDSVVGDRMTMNFICLGAVFFVLLLAYRNLSRAVFIIIPVGAVIAWSSLDMYLVGIPLNPLTAVLGIIMIGICTEFMVLILGRYQEERGNGLPPKDAMITALSKIGQAIITTALTTLGGFGVLIASDFILIRDFGIVTVLGVFLCLVITITVMPGIIVWYDNIVERRRAKTR